MTTMDRGAFVRRAGMVGGALAVLGPLEAFSARKAIGAPVRTVGYGPLVPKGDIALPAAFDYQVISRQGIPMSDGNPTPGIFDGMAAYRGRGKGETILIRNHENRERAGEIPVVVPPDKSYDYPGTVGGNTKLVVRRRKTGRETYAYEVVRDFAILGGTSTNCGGGVLKDRWITCEEVVKRTAATGRKHGYSFDIDAYADGPVEARPIVAAGRFSHEAAAWYRGVLYQTEDRSISADPLAPHPQSKKLLGACLYRYIPRGGAHGRNLADTTGVLQALKIRGEWHANMDVGREVGKPYPVEWVTIDEADHEDDTDNRRDRVAGFTPVRVQAQDRGAAFFDRQEGMWVDEARYGSEDDEDDDEDDERRKRGGSGLVYFDCTSGGALKLGQVWAYDPRRETLTLVYESTSATDLQSPDNIVVVPPTGDIFLQEDGDGVQYVRGLTPDGLIYDFAMTITNGSEFCGGCFDPDARTFFLNQQGERGSLPAGPAGEGAVTYAIFGPFGGRRKHDD
jgi:uncharacterized protein